MWTLLDDHEVDLAIGGRPLRHTCDTTEPDRRRRGTRVRPATIRPATPQSPGLRTTTKPVSAATLGRSVWLLREQGSGTRTTTLELFDELGIQPATLTLGSNGAIRESVQVGLGITLISLDAVARELDTGS